MEIRIDERLVDVFNEVVEKEAKFFNGERNLEKVMNTQLADFFRFINEENNYKLLSEEASDKLVGFLIEEIKDDEIGRGLAILVKALKKNAAKNKKEKN